MAHLDGVPRASRKDGQEVFEDAHPLDRVRGRELHEERAEPVAEEPHRLDEGPGRLLGAHQVVLVRDLLGVQYTTRKRAHSHPRYRETMSILPSPSEG